jgi:hypothetical protein
VNQTLVGRRLERPGGNTGDNRANQQATGTDNDQTTARGAGMWLCAWRCGRKRLRFVNFNTRIAC